MQQDFYHGLGACVPAAILDLQLSRALMSLAETAAYVLNNVTGENLEGIVHAAVSSRRSVNISTVWRTEAT